VHLEAPFLNPAKGGAHRKEFLLMPSVRKFRELYDLSNGSIRILSIAPELDGALELVAYAKELGVVTALAHSEADFAATGGAIAAGMTLCDHLFNGMLPFTNRSPGPIGAFLTDDTTFVELISDGYHVHPAVMKVVIRAKGPDRVALVTDAVTPAGTDMDSFVILGTTLKVRGSSCFTPDGTLAGSALTMNKAVKVILDNNVASLEDVLKMASLTPARVLGLDRKKGTLEVGKDADLVVADDDLNVFLTVSEGRIVYSS
jgi:N-acetylglucosamine-6-phosphate deacetylase